MLRQLWQTSAAPLDPLLPPELELEPPVVPLVPHSNAQTEQALHPQVSSARSSLTAVVPAVFSHVVGQAESVGEQAPRQLLNVTQLLSALHALA